MMNSLRQLIRMSLVEDMPDRDITTNLVYPEPMNVETRIISKQDAVFFGETIVREVVSIVDSDLIACCKVRDGDKMSRGQEIITISGSIQSILKLERVLLNFLQRLCGIATITAAYVNALNNPNVAVVDTRKTTPGMRLLEKQAVAAGGGQNHRFSLSDMVLLKENHLAGFEDLGSVLSAFKSENPDILVEVEVTNMAEVQSLDLSKADIIMLDNFFYQDIELAVSTCRARGFQAQIEISGNVTLNNIHQYAELPIDRIAIGRLTHSVEAVDLSLLLQ